ncbi:uncharacterized protein LOC110975473 isoform X2 [Acanthaster planci]|uniref:Uncharacterized protein LOC110975473 isoform X2 n=1 Tax=Acanthaster planci TaxID=133434 RepID=A0A8B7XS66_ACAPL|nr:uncharacterized protein LOC110975473 isoform X2 [Acanthaster planci]
MATVLILVVVVFALFSTESEGEYTCELTDPYNDEGHEQQKTNLQVGNCGPSTLVSIVDPSTEAVLDDPQYGSICVQSGSTRLFQCLIQSTSPCVYNISWMLGHEIAIGTAAALSPSSGGPMVNVSSFLSVQHPRNETRGSNLSCMATSRQECKSLNSTIRLTFCPGSEYEKTVIGVLISLCVAATIAALIAEVLIYKHYNG